MLENISNELMLAVGGAFILGWILAAMVASIRSGSRSDQQDPRDIRIRTLEAELRIAQSDSVDSKKGREELQDALKETTVGLERRDDVISKQQCKLEQVSTDLKDAVKKTRELRAELVNRATQGVHAEAKIREVETELSVAQASTDMIATGILDYSLSPNAKAPAEFVLEEDLELNTPDKKTR